MEKDFISLLHIRVPPSFLYKSTCRKATMKPKKFHGNTCESLRDGPEYILSVKVGDKLSTP